MKQGSRLSPDLRAACDKRPKPTKPNELWEADLTYIQEAYIDYNRRRIHSSLGYMTPYEFLARVKVTQHDG